MRESIKVIDVSLYNLALFYKNYDFMYNFDNSVTVLGKLLSFSQMSIFQAQKMSFTWLGRTMGILSGFKLSFAADTDLFIFNLECYQYRFIGKM